MAGNPSADATVWTGWDLRGGADPDEAGTAFAATPGAGAEDRYRLMAVAARGFRPPVFVTRRGIGDASSAAASGGADGGVGALVRRTWSLVYRPLAPSPVPPNPHHAIYLLGVDPPPDASEDDLDTFEDFYVHVHVPEVAERRRALRAVPHRLVEVVRAPHRGAPQLLTAYELDERSASVRRHTGPPYRRGPDVWQRHTTPWRLWYRHIPPAT